MLKLLLSVVIGFSFASYGSEPQVVITTKNSYNGFGTVAGRVISDSKNLIGVSVDNGGVRYSTIADPSGAWAIVFRHAAVNFVVKAWQAGGETKREVIIEGELPLDANESVALGH